LCGFVFLIRIDQDDARHDFGHTGGISYHHILVLHKFMSSVGYLIPFKLCSSVTHMEYIEQVLHIIITSNKKNKLTINSIQLKRDNSIINLFQVLFAHLCHSFP